MVERCKLSFLMRRLVFAASALLLLAYMLGCGGRVDTGVKSTPSVSVLKGVFLDAPVGGLNYATPTIRSVTKADGVFEYLPGETVTFSIGKFVLGSTSGKPVVTPLDIVPGARDASDHRVVNICVVLQTLDEDGNPENGIQISEKVSDVISQRHQSIHIDKPARAFSFDGGFRSAMAELNYIDAFGDLPRAVKPPAVAQKHLEATLKKIQSKK
jgi:para-nitrobenzyl esterase